MKNLIIVIAFLTSSLSFAKGSDFTLKNIKFGMFKIRTGIMKTKRENKKGTVLYLEGLGDSMLNHSPLFNSLVDDGFDVIAFDYIGQGGSTGNMNFTTIQNIQILAKRVWDQYISDPREKKILLGWSTGGLAAYRYAYKFPSEVESLILLAPGISPKVWIGDRMRITMETLTQNEFSRGFDPHIDPIRPTSPLQAPAFAINLISTAALARYWKIPKSVSGLVLLSSREDTYVNSEKTINVLEARASHFGYHMYEGTGALHELDNEFEDIAADVRARILSFLNN
ncbi:MAG: alpha-beta hydrolase superfamily lysophospholipase [Bacteriovoracaceae bacterium]|jgi:pimeloyl-ACP methyl ester carboxylesterase